MNKKTLIILIVLFVILAGLVLAYFYIFKKPSTEQGSQTKIEKDGFIIDLLDGWEETESISGSMATAFNNKEITEDENAQKLGFKSYYSVVYDILGEGNQDDYLKKLKTSLQQSFPEASFLESQNQALDGKTTYYIETELIQQNVDFKVLLAVNIKDKDVWIISFNTLKEKWEEYKNSFYQIAEGFKIK